MIEQATNFFGVRFAQRSTEHGKVLRENVNESSIDRAIAGDDTIAIKGLLVRAETGRAGRNKDAQFLKRSFVQQQLDAFPGGQFAFGVLLINAFLSAAQPGLLRACGAVREFSDQWTLSSPQKTFSPQKAQGTEKNIFSFSVFSRLWLKIT
jgi:hypothetical protein